MPVARPLAPHMNENSGQIVWVMRSWDGRSQERRYAGQRYRTMTIPFARFAIVFVMRWGTSAGYRAVSPALSS